MSLPVMTNKEDVDEIVAFLKRKPVGIAVEAAKATIEPRLLDGRKRNAYRIWGFVADEGGTMSLTPLGREYYEASEDRKKSIFADILRNEKVYRVTLEWIHRRKFDQVPVDEIAGHWYEHFKDEVGVAERSINEQVTCFMSVVSAAGLGSYIKGRRNKPTRLEINTGALDDFISELYNASDSSDVEGVIDVSEQVGETAEAEVTPEKPLQPSFSQGPVSTPSNLLSLHIDIQIHIDPEASSEQIDQIFASMAKHLYQNE